MSYFLVEEEKKIVHGGDQLYCIASLYAREYWMIYREPGFLAVVWFGPPPSPSPVSLSQSSCVSPDELNDGRGGGGLEKPNRTTARNCSTINYSMLPAPRPCLSLLLTVLLLNDDISGCLLLFFSPCIPTPPPHFCLPLAAPKRVPRSVYQTFLPLATGIATSMHVWSITAYVHAI
jgi:hypothetical protein